jgi:hypothetical protein
MAVSLRERPSISGKDADRLMKKIAENNLHHQKLVEQMVKEKLHAKNTGVRAK